MKLRDIPRALGFERPPTEYPYEVATFSLATDGEVQLARWLHPAERRKVVTQASVDALREFLHEGDVAVDIGAHTGDTSLPMALAVGRTGVVFAVEPNPYVFKVLAVNAGLNASTTRIVPLMFAAMPEDGEFEFEYSDPGYCNGGFHQGIGRWTHGHFSTLRVTGRNLADYLQRQHPDNLSRLRYVKIDTEGFDRPVMRSLEDVLRTFRPYIKAEIYKHQPQAERIGFYEDFRRLRYRMFKAEGDRYRGQEIDRNDLSRWKHFDVFAVPEERI